MKKESETTINGILYLEKVLKKLIFGKHLSIPKANDSKILSVSRETFSTFLELNSIVNSDNLDRILSAFNNSYIIVLIKSRESNKTLPVMYKINLLYSYLDFNIILKREKGTVNNRFKKSDNALIESVSSHKVKTNYILFRDRTNIKLFKYM